MTANDVRYAAELADALDDIAEVRKGLRKKAGCGKIYLEIQAYESHGESGGMGLGESLIPVRLASKILDQVEMLIGDELARLGVE